MSETQAIESAPAAPSSPLRWYVVHAYSGMEKAVERNLRERIERSGMHSKFGRILVPTEEVVELKHGKKSVSERRFFPGYVLVEMLMDDESWHLVKHTSKVTGFVGGAKNRPAPISAHVRANARDRGGSWRPGSRAGAYQNRSCAAGSFCSMVNSLWSWVTANSSCTSGSSAHNRSSPLYSRTFLCSMINRLSAVL